MAAAATKQLPLSHYSEAFPGGSVVENLPLNAAAGGSIPGLGRSPGEGNGNALQYSGLETRIYIVHGISKS